MGGPKVLFVDDDLSIRETLPIILAAEGFNVTTVASVPAALAKIGEEPFDILLADLNIGEPGDGFTVVSAMRRLQPDARTYILTGYPDFASALEAIRRQVDDYLIKPTDVPTLLKTLRSNAERPRTTEFFSKRASMIIRENVGSIIEKWEQETGRSPQFRGFRVSRKELIDHLPALLNQLADLLDHHPRSEKTHLDSAAEHGRARRRQGSSVTMIVAESRILYRVIADCVQHHLLEMDISRLVPDLISISDNLNQMLSESLRAFLSEEPIAA
jgi:ActR/RegA family two-component response regulator